MHFADFARAVFALAMTMGLIGLAAVALRKWGPETLARLGAARRERRMAVIETLVLDPARRLVLVSLDGEERLLLLGEGQILPHHLPPPPAKTRAATPKAPAGGKV